MRGLSHPAKGSRLQRERGRASEVTKNGARQAGKSTPGTGEKISHVLLPRRGGGRLPVTEVLRATPAVRSLIREGKTRQLSAGMQASSQAGMRPCWYRATVDYNHAGLSAYIFFRNQESCSEERK